MSTPERAVSLLGAGAIRQLAAQLSLRPTKTLGQNFVHDAGTLRRIVAAAQLQPGEQVLEVGPGLGSLTLALLEAGHQVLAVEIDPRLATLLPKTVGAHAPGALDALEVMERDALALTTDECGAVPPTALVANLPYNVSVPVLLHLLDELPSLRRVLVMVQAEVADRLAAAPGSRTYGIPSAKAAWYGTVRRVGSVGRAVFWPQPNVDSALVSLDRDVHRPPELRAGVFAVVDAAFAQRRKMLRTALAGWAGSAGAAAGILRRAGIDPALRGEQLCVQDFQAIYQAAQEEQ